MYRLGSGGAPGLIGLASPACPLQPAANSGLVGEIDLTKLAFQIGFLAGDHAKANDEIERRQRGKDPSLLKPIARPAWPKNMQM
jgi:hypothetical protein